MIKIYSNRKDTKINLFPKTSLAISIAIIIIMKIITTLYNNKNNSKIALKISL